MPFQIVICVFVAGELAGAQRCGQHAGCNARKPDAIEAARSGPPSGAVPLVRCKPPLHLQASLGAGGPWAGWYPQVQWGQQHPIGIHNLQLLNRVTAIRNAAFHASIRPSSSLHYRDPDTGDSRCRHECGRDYQHVSRWPGKRGCSCWSRRAAGQHPGRAGRGETRGCIANGWIMGSCSCWSLEDISADSGFPAPPNPDAACSPLWLGSASSKCSAP